MSFLQTIEHILYSIFPIEFKYLEEIELKLHIH